MVAFKDEGINAGDLIDDSPVDISEVCDQSQGFVAVLKAESDWLRSVVGNFEGFDFQIPEVQGGTGFQHI